MLDTLWEAEQRRASWRTRGTDRLTVPPTLEPVSLELFGLHARVTSDDEAQLAEMYIQSARVWLEGYTGRAFLSQTRTVTRDVSPDGTAAIVLPTAPLLSVTSVTSYSATDVPTVMSNATYLVDTSTEPGRVLLNNGVAWPSDVRGYNAVAVAYVAGYGTTEESVPVELRHAVLMLAAHWYRSREAATDESMSEMPFGITTIADRYRLMVQ